MDYCYDRSVLLIWGEVYGWMACALWEVSMGVGSLGRGYVGVSTVAVKTTRSFDLVFFMFTVPAY